MDPNEALAIIRAAAERYRDDLSTEVEDLAPALEAFEALDEWLSKGGFLPGAWAIPGERG